MRTLITPRALSSAVLVHVAERTHPIVEQTVFLEQVHDVENISRIGLQVRHAEVEPPETIIQKVRVCESEQILKTNRKKTQWPQQLCAHRNAKTKTRRRRREERTECV